MRIKSFSYVVVAVVYASIQIQKRIFRNQRIIIEKFSDVILIVNENFRNIEGERGKQKKLITKVNAAAYRIFQSKKECPEKRIYRRTVMKHTKKSK